MNMKYYNPSNNFSAPIRREPRPYAPRRRPETIVPQKPPQRGDDVPHTGDSTARGENRAVPGAKKDAPGAKKGAPTKSAPNFSELSGDDLLLLGIIALLIWNACDDGLLLLALVYLFLCKRQESLPPILKI